MIRTAPLSEKFQLTLGQRMFTAPPKEWVEHRLADIQDILEKETEESALLLRKLLGLIVLNPTIPDIGKPFYHIATNFDVVALYPAGHKSSNSLRWRRELDNFRTACFQLIV